MGRSLAIVPYLVFLTFAEQAIAADTGIAVWCINASQDVPTEIRQITLTSGENGCYIFAETPHESGDVEVAYHNPKPSGMACEDEFVRSQFEQKDDGFRCGGWFVVEDMERDLMPTMDVALDRIKSYIEYSSSKEIDLTVIDITMDFSNVGNWADDPEVSDPQGMQEWTFDGLATAVVTFGRTPETSDTFDAFVAYLDTEEYWEGADDPTRDEAPWHVVNIGERLIHPCFGGGAQVTAIGVNYLMEVTEFDYWEVPDWHNVDCSAEAEVMKKSKGHKHYAYKEDGSFELVDYDPR